MKRCQRKGGYINHMIDLNALTSDELTLMEKKWRREADHYNILADLCFNIRVGRDTAVMLRTVQAARQRALTGTCHCPAKDCPVHQMGGRRALEESTGVINAADLL